MTSRLSPSRRSFLQVTAAAAAFQIVTEPMLAAAARRPYAKDGVMIDSNENPLGPGQAAREAISAIIPQGGRYLLNLTEDLIETFAQQEGLNPDYVHVFAGSSPALRFTVVAFTSPHRSYVTADPGYEGGMMAAGASQARVVKVPLNKAYAHDVKGMIAAAPDAGLFYICNPNNPTGTLTPHADIEFLVENKPKGSIVMVDEAYLHFCDAPSTIDLVKAGKDVVVLRTFSKTYGMTGWRAGYAVAKEPFMTALKKIVLYSTNGVTTFVQNAMIEALKTPEAEIARLREEYRKRRDLIVAGLNEVGLTCEPPAGAFYAFPNVEKVSKNSREAAQILLERAHIATIPGSVFGAQGEGHLRFGYAVTVDEIEACVGALKEFFG